MDQVVESIEDLLIKSLDSTVETPKSIETCMQLDQYGVCLHYILLAYMLGRCYYKCMMAYCLTHVTYAQALFRPEIIEFSVLKATFL